jgi:hypothetical protein
MLLDGVVCNARAWQLGGRPIWMKPSRRRQSTTLKRECRSKRITSYSRLQMD